MILRACEPEVLLSLPPLAPCLLKDTALPAVVMGAGAGGWLEPVGVPDGTGPLTSTEAVGLERGPRLVEVCGVAGAPEALFWRMIPEGT